jgi:hypothetical protein
MVASMILFCYIIEYLRYLCAFLYYISILICDKNNPDQRSLNATCVRDPFPTPFADDVL